MQAAKPQWPADDCYHSCCNGEKAPTSTAVVSSRKEVTPSKKAASKAADKVSAHVSEEGEEGWSALSVMGHWQSVSMPSFSVSYPKRPS